ncbi:trigger factor [Cyanobacterium sp. IPPAS B-1200]|uniref:trigger factor n=1 Tax=Cyanobacterium sp. IPPAS B-1200 TaxID=1562720 RepID=UPI00085252B2|nr:trigger factor [Cyanobacterium sp. IPPAS B-1200]OEJ78640.1 trigger factor [Cyanobacterium sp. IPPAS B-1200]
MKITQEKLPASQIGLEIEIPAETSKKTYEKVITQIARTTNIPGFRQGKVPRPILLQRLGHDRIKAAVLEELIQDSLKTAIEQESIESLGNYSLRSEFEELVNNYQPGNAFVFKAAVDVPPEVTLGQYQGLKVQAEEIKYDPEAVNGLIEEQRQRLATLVPVEDRAAQMGDTAIVDFEGRKPAENEGEEGELIEGTKAEEFQVELAEGKFIPGFVEGIVGMNIDESKKLDLTFPEDYPQKELANQPVIFSITLKDLKEKELPEVDDEFVKEVSEFETVAELRESLEKQYQEKAENDTKLNIQGALVDELLKHTTIEIPETMMEEEVQNLLMQTANEIQRMGVDVNQFFTREMVGKMRETARPEASKNLHTNLIIEKIAEQESITLTEEEISEKIAEVTKEMNPSEIDQNKLQKFVKNDLLSDKVLTFLQEKNEVELVPEGSLTPEEAEATSEGEVEQVSAE